MNDPIEAALDAKVSDIIDGGENTPALLNPMVLANVETPSKKPVEAVSTDDMLLDYAYTRKVLQNNLQAAQESLRSITEFTNAAPSPRAYEVLTGLLKIVNETSKELLDIQKTIKELTMKNSTSQNAENIVNIQSNQYTLSDMLDKAKTYLENGSEINTIKGEVTK